MDNIKILLTGIGCPGATTIISALRNNPDNEPVEIIGTDCRDNAAGRFFTDRFHVVPPGSHPQFIGSILDIAAEEDVDVVFPQISGETLAFAHHWDEFPIPVMVTNERAAEACIDKVETYSMAEALEIPVPRWKHCQESWEMDDFAREQLGIGAEVFYKPRIGKGSRGIGSFIYTSSTIVPDFDDFDIIAMETIHGPNRTIDALCLDGQILAPFSRLWGDRSRCGFWTEHEVISSPVLLDYATRIIEYLDYSWFINVQFKGDYLIEVNPRTSTQILSPTFNLPWLGVKLALGIIDYTDILSSPPTLASGYKSVYYYKQIFYSPDRPEEEVK